MISDQEELDEFDQGYSSTLAGVITAGAQAASM